jgi:hypothetical protein
MLSDTPMSTLDEIRFWDSFDMSAGPEACWLWARIPSGSGYGSLGIGKRWPNRKTYRAHKVMWQLINGPVPHGLFVCHHCDNRLCVNPRHLFLGTQTDNMVDMVRKGRAAKAHGENNNNSKLSVDDVKAIRGLSAAGFCRYSIGAAFGIVHSHVTQISTRRRWAHVD